ncbi:MAG: hypothetical protein JL50_14150 [Peptococcaceae bacterium BICA1-7]|nr:MAG: hypothetical protein JL50_14150 [Peptococcaceae bacterium BICA1-7]HBV96417.1 XRE family transcriptional regulator [Desulfotomaculum sp.]
MEEGIIAQRIKSIRKQRGFTLDEVARRTGFTKGLLSKVENNKVSPPVSTLVKIAKALDVTLGDLFSASDGQQIRIVRKGERASYNPEYQGGRQIIETLVSGFYRQRMEPVIITIDAAGEHEPRLYSHPGQEFIFVLEGTMNYIYGEERYTLMEGDSLYFNSEFRHGASPVPGKNVKYLSILCT